MQAAFATGFAGANSLFKPGFFSRQIVARHDGMVEMIDDGPAVHELAATSKVVDAGAEVGIGADTAAEETFIKTINGEDIVAPEGHVAADDAALFFVTKDDGPGKAYAFGGAADSAGDHPPPNGFCLGIKSGDELFLDKTAAPLDPKAGLGEALVVGNELRMRNAIAIREDEILTDSLGDGFVEKNGFAKSVVRMPEVVNGECDFAAPILDEETGFVAGTIVGDEDFIGKPGLATDAPEHLRERRGLFVGADNERQFHADSFLTWLRASGTCAASRSLAYRTRVENAVWQAM